MQRYAFCLNNKILLDYFCGSDGRESGVFQDFKGLVQEKPPSIAVERDKRSL